MAVSLVAPAMVFMGLLVHAEYLEGRRRYEAQLVAMTRALSLATDRQVALGQATLQALAVSPSLQTGDFARFGQMLCNGGTLDGKRILGRKTIELMTANHMATLPNNQAAARQKGFGLGVEVTTDLGQLSMPSSIGQFGWYGAATTYCQIDPKEKIVAIALAQHFPFNQQGFFAQFQTGYYQALK